MRVRGALVLLLLASMPGVAHADVTPVAGPGDGRIQTVLYDPEQVVTLQVAAGFALTVAFGTDERIENIVVGNSAAWQVTPNRRGDHLFIKPMAGAATTNMEVITDARHYSFALEPAYDGAQAAFLVRFRYPSVPPDAETIVPPPAAGSYRLSGDPALRPDAMSDDGERTAIHWPAGVALPAVYAVDQRGRESIVDGRMVDGVYVIERIAPRFVFRADRRHATATRDVGKGATR